MLPVQKADIGGFLVSNLLVRTSKLHRVVVYQDLTYTELVWKKKKVGLNAPKNCSAIDRIWAN